jgi:hypothetical protein
MNRRTRIVATVAALVGIGAVAWGATSYRSRRITLLHIPKTSAPIVINAEVEGKKEWESEKGCTQNLKDGAGHGMVPYTQAKLRWSEDKLYLLLYAGDLDLEGRVTQPDGPVDGDDSFQLEFGSGDDLRQISVSVLGTVADAWCRGDGAARRCDAQWQSHAEVAVDRDGTVNVVGDNDEEWVVEMAVPFASLGIDRPKPGLRIPFTVRRCEVGQRGARACGSWGVASRGELELEG